MPFYRFLSFFCCFSFYRRLSCRLSLFGLFSLVSHCSWYLSEYIYIRVVACRSVEPNRSVPTLVKQKECKFVRKTLSLKQQSIQLGVVEGRFRYSRYTLIYPCSLSVKVRSGAHFYLQLSFFLFLSLFFPASFLPLSSQCEHFIGKYGDKIHSGGGG